MPDEPNSPPPQPLERKLSTILSADVAEYSRLMGEDEEQTLNTFRAHKQVFESLVAMHRGRVFNTAGDAILAEFASAVEAVRCATEIQAALHTCNDQLPPSRQVRFRIGINLGDVMVHGQDLLGDGVNVAARLQSAAEPGGICISGSVHDQIRNKLSLSFHSLGEMNFKNIRHSVRTFSVTEAEGHGTLPSSRTEQRAAASSSTKWIVAAALVLVAAAGYWAFAENRRSKAEQALVQAGAAKQAATQRQADVLAGKLAAEEAQSRTNAQRQPRAAAAHPALAPEPKPGAEPKKVEPAGQLSAAASPPPHVVAAAPAPASASASASAPAKTLSSSLDGVYAGPLCYGPGPNKEEARCIKAQATINNGKISSKWPSGRDTGVTMILLGDVSPSGAVTIHMHTEGGPANHVIRIDLSGTLRDGHLDANGNFHNGRSATLNWRKNPTPPH